MVRHEKTKTNRGQDQDRKKTTSTGKHVRGRGRFKPSSKSKRKETRTCHFCNMPGHIRANCFAWKKEQDKQGNALQFTPTVHHWWLDQCGWQTEKNSKILLDCGASTIYVSKRWVEENQLKTTKFNDKNIRVPLGDNQIVLPLSIAVSALDEAYGCVAVVYAIPDEVDYILGIPLFEDEQPQINWRGRRIEGTQVKTLCWERTGETGGPIEEGRPAIASRLRRSVRAKGLSAKRPDSYAALETDVKSLVKPVHDSEQRQTPSVACEQLENASAGKGSADEGEMKSSGRDGSVAESS
ncbi:LOW QUALITY PROTEIN: hypothetical protein PHMEG_0002435 [Phytophthora megakarya]|uniref:CCHC-type domain-containing protein n=1 Tax=Phytophthora megakarya TaxID=4795 RepID=A0A225WZ58_9STRA|nr:LOW QUALITY PROTEIN: hypothetical protein PHMEG_0002435 [Phytophthora megakarya]